MGDSNVVSVPVGRNARGLTIAHNGATVETRGVFLHNHEASRTVRRLAEDVHWPVVRTDGGRRFGGAVLVIGGGVREQARLIEGDHNCASLVTAHDVAHARCGSCADGATCSVRSDVAYACDYLYYLNAGQVGELMDRHQSAAAYFAINAPYVGGCGVRNAGETVWERVGETATVRVTTDGVTREVWQHSDMVWLLTSNHAYVGGRCLTWTPARNDGGRMLWRFAWHYGATPLGGAVPVIPTLRQWLHGGTTLEATYDHEPLCYTARQVFTVLGDGRDCAADARVRMPHVLEVALYLGKNAGQLERWPLLAAQKAGGLKGVDHVEATAALAVEIAHTRRLAWERAGAAWCTPAWRRGLPHRLRFGAACVAAAITPTVAVYVVARHGVRPTWQAAKDGIRLFAGPLVIGAAAIAGMCWWTAAAQYVARTFEADYTAKSVYPTCYPVEEEAYKTPRGEYRVDACDCTEFRAKPAYELVGIALRGARIAVACSCPKTFANAMKRRILDLPLPPATAPLAAADCARAFQRVALGREGSILDSGRYAFSTWSTRASFSKAATRELCKARAEWSGNERYKPIGGFVKVELAAKWGDGCGDIELKPRMIRPVDYALRARVGPGIAGVQHAAKTVLAGGAILLGCGRDGRAVGEWYDKATARAAALGEGVGMMLADYGNFDGTNTMGGGQIAGTSAMLSLGWPAPDAAIDAAASRTMDTTFGGAGRWNAGCACREVDPSVFSGKDCTTIRNSCCNASVHCACIEAAALPLVSVAAATYVRDAGMVDFAGYEAVAETAADDALARASERIAGSGPRSAAYLERVYAGGAAVMGDDGLAVLPLSHLHKYKRSFDAISTAMGYVPESVAVYSAHEVEFCSSLAWPSQAGTTFGPKIGRILAKTGYKRAHHPRKIRMRMLRGDALSLAPGVAHIPVLRVWVQVILRLTVGVQEITEPEMRYKLLAISAQAMSPDVWAFAEARYGLTRAEIEELEAQLWRLRALPATLTDERWSRFLERDT